MLASGKIKIKIQNSRKLSSPRWLILLLALLVSGLPISIQYQKAYAAVVEDNMQVKASATITFKREYLSDTLSQLENQVRTLVDNPFTQAYVSSNTKSARNNLTQLFLAVSNANEYYMQVRFLDAQGQERVRIDRPRDNPVPRIIPDKELQNKSSRGYFKFTKKLPTGQLWKSKFDLNKERGAIEKPINPTFRVASPVYSGGKFSGIVIINLAMSRVASVLNESTDFMVYLVDGDGDFLLHPEPEQAWSRYLPGRTGYQEPSENVHKTYSHSLEDLFKNGEEIRLILKPIKAITSSFSTPGRQVILTQEERQWIKQHNVKVGIEEWAPIVFTKKDGNAGGLAGSYLDLLAQRTGLKFEIISDEWNTLLTGLKEKNIELLPATYFTEERATYGLYSSPYFTMREFLYVKEDSRITAMDDLAKGRIAVVKGYGTIPKIREKYPHITIIETKNLMDSINRVLNSEVDALLEAQIAVAQTIKTNAIIGLKSISQNVFPASPVCLFSRNDAPLLKSILQKGLDSISEKESQALQKKWISIVDTDSDKVKLTSAEQQWLSEHKDIKLGIDSAWPPFEFVDGSGAYTGLSAGYIKVLNRRLGVSMEPVLGLSWTQVINKFKQGDLDLLPAVMHTPQREKFLNFTQPYISSPMVIAIRRGGNVLISSINDFKGKRIGVVKGYASVDLLKIDHPDLLLVEKTNVVQLLKDLDAGKIDAAVENVGVISYEMERLNLSNIQVVAPTPYNYDISIGVRKDWPELVSIIDKAIASLNQKEKDAIRNTWMAHQVKFGLDIRTILLYASPFMVVVLIIIFSIVMWNRRLSGEIANRKAAEFKIRAMSDASHDAMIMINSKGIVMFWNTAAEKMFEYTNEEVINKNMHALFVPEELRKPAHAGLKQFAKSGKGAVIGSLIEQNALKRSGELFPVEIAISSFQLENEWYAVGFVRDITDRKKIESQIKAARKELLLIFNSSHIGIIFTHKKGEIARVNRRMADILGYENLKSMIGINTRSLLLDDEQVQSFKTASIESLLQGKNAQLEYELRKSDGSTIWCSLSGKAVDTKQSPDLEKGVIWVVEDITQRRQMEEEIRKSEENFRIIADYTYGWESWYNKKGTLLWVNPAVERITGYTVEECHLQSSFPDSFVHPDDISIFTDIKNKAIDGKEGDGVPFRIIHKTERKEIWGEISWNPVFDKQGQVTGYRTSVQNITDRKKTESEMKEYVADLEKFNQITISREERMIDLKDEINQLLTQQGKENKYKIR